MMGEENTQDERNREEEVMRREKKTEGDMSWSQEKAYINRQTHTADRETLGDYHFIAN